MCVPISSTNTNRLPSSCLPTVERHTSLSHSSRSLAPADLFSAVPQALDHPAYRRLAHLNPTNREEELAPLLVSSPWSSLEVSFEQPHGSFVQLRTLAGPPLRGKRAAFVEPLEITLNRGTVDAEPAGGLAFGDAPPDGLHYLFAQV